MAEEKASAYIREFAALLQRFEVATRDGTKIALDDAANEAVNILLSTKDSGNKVMSIGNGGSAAIVSHIQMDLCNAVGVQAVVFNETALLTALSNDYGYQYAFERLVNQWGKPGDLLIAISSSGESENILRAARAAHDKSCRVITMSGFKPDNPLRLLGELNFYVSSSAYGYVELAHSVLCHYLTDRAAAVGNSSGE